jgi:hypothetical protein
MKLMSRRFAFFRFWYLAASALNRSSASRLKPHLARTGLTGAVFAMSVHQGGPEAAFWGPRGPLLTPNGHPGRHL